LRRSGFGPIRRFQPIGNDLGKGFKLADNQLEATDLLGGILERSGFRLKVRPAPPKLGSRGSNGASAMIPSA